MIRTAALLMSLLALCLFALLAASFLPRGPSPANSPQVTAYRPFVYLDTATGTVIACVASKTQRLYPPLFISQPIPISTAIVAPGAAGSPPQAANH